MEKVLLKISGAIAIVIGIGWCFTIIGLLWGIPLIVGGSTMIGYGNLSDGKIIDKKGSILGWSIFFLIFTVIGGVVGLLFYFTIDSKIFTPKRSYIDELRDLEDLRKEGLITKEEFEAKKKKILDI